MADVKTWLVPKYPEAKKLFLMNVLNETSQARVELDAYDKLLRETANPTQDMLKEWARKSVGWKNYIRKKLKVLDHACIKEAGEIKADIKLQCAQLGITYVDNSAKSDAELYVSPIRKVRYILDSYVEGASDLVSVCRLHFYGDQGEQKQVDI